MRQKTVCFTGHRKIPPEKLKDISKRLKATLIQLIENDYMYFGAGGALGFDTLAAQTVLELRKQYTHIKLILVFPCETQIRGWKQKDIEIYENIKRQADKVVCLSEKYTIDCMQKRNRHLVNNSSVCVSYLTKNQGGTAYTVDYALKHGLTVLNIADYL